MDGRQRLKIGLTACDIIEEYKLYSARDHRWGFIAKSFVLLISLQKLVLQVGEMAEELIDNWLVERNNWLNKSFQISHLIYLISSSTHSSCNLFRIIHCCRFCQPISGRDLIFLSDMLFEGVFVCLYLYFGTKCQSFPSTSSAGGSRGQFVLRI